MSNSPNIPPPPPPPPQQQQQYLQQYPYNYYQLYPFNGYTFQSTQQSSHHYHFPHLTTPFKHSIQNTYPQTVPINRTPSEQQHNIKLQSNSIIVNHNSTQNNTFNPPIQQPRVSPKHSLKNEQNAIKDQKIIATRTDHKQHKHYNYKHSNSERIATDTDPIAYLDTHDTIRNSLMKQLIKRSSKLRKLNLKIYGLCEIGNHLWLKQSRKKGGPVVFNKIRALKFQEFTEWIQQQIAHTTDIWKSQICTQPSADKVLENIVKKCKSIKNRQNVENCINKYRHRLMNFLHAVRKLYGINVKKIKKTLKSKSKSNICWRCGKTNHKMFECHSSRDIDGNKLTQGCDTRRFKPHSVQNGTIHMCSPKIEMDVKHHKDEALQSCIKCGYVHCQCDGNKLIKNKRKFTDSVHGTVEFEPVFKKRKIHSVDEQIKIKIESSDDNGMNNVNALKSEPMDSSKHNDGIICSNCDKDLQGKDMWRCSRCKVSFYCDRQCQLDHWKEHKIKCEVSIDTGMQIKVKLEKIEVNEWTHFSVIYWLNRVNDNMFNNVKYKYLRKHIVMGKIKGCDLLLVNKVTLRMMGIDDVNEQDALLNAIADVVMNDNFDNVLANRMKINDIPIKYVDPVLYEIMDEPVEVMQSRYIYDKKFIEEYIEEHKSDPMTQRYTDLSDIVPCEQLSIEIDKWKQQYLIPLS